MIQARTQQLAEIDIAPEDIHERARLHAGVDGVLLIGAFIGLLVDFYAIKLMVSGSLGSGILLHLAVSAVAIFYAMTTHKSKNRDGRMAILFAVFTMLLGPVGAAGMVLCMLYYHISSARALSFEEWYRSIFPQDVRTLAEEIHENIKYGRDESAKPYEVIPFRDIMVLGNNAQKREALIKMAQYFHPDFAPALKLALDDRNNSVRVQAATTITKIKNQFLEREIILKDAMKDYPDRPLVIKALAKHYDDYAYTGLLEKRREEENRKKALELYRKYLNLVPNDVEVRQAIGRLQIRNGDVSDATQWFESCVREGYTTPNIITWYAECLYQQHRFKELRDLATQHAHNVAHDPNYPAAIRESMLLWSRRTSADLQNVPTTSMSANSEPKFFEDERI